MYDQPAATAQPVLLVPMIVKPASGRSRWSWSAARVDLPVDAIGVEAARVRHFGCQVDDVEHPARGAPEGDAVAVGRHDVGRAVDGDALVIIARPIEAVPCR